MKKIATHKGEGHMKKISLLILVVSVMVLVVSATAFADTTSTYASWPGGAGSPHNDYTTTSVKCAVCHAVHKAETGGQVLLRTTVADACTYCHITSNTGNVQLYNANSSWYSTASQHAHNNACTNCHAVHGADTITAIVGDKILKNSPTNGGNTYTPQAGTTWTNSSRDEVVSKFCSSCHPYYVGAYEGTHSGSLTDSNTYKGHIMTTDTASYGNGNANYTGQVAWAESYTCRDCHDAGSVNQGTGVHADNFPHYTTGLRFNLSAGSVASATAAAATANENGVCLKCHRQNGTTGIGFDF